MGARTLPPLPGLLSLDGLLRDFRDTAHALQACDLLITVDTAVAHLAGALAKPVWILLPYAPDWRWLQNRRDSPWYPTARLFRQSRLGMWDDALANLEQELADFVAKQPHAAP